MIIHTLKPTAGLPALVTSRPKQDVLQGNALIGHEGREESLSSLASGLLGSGLLAGSSLLLDLDGGSLGGSGVRVEGEEDGLKNVIGEDQFPTSSKDKKQTIRGQGGEKKRRLTLFLRGFFFWVKGRLAIFWPPSRRTDWISSELTGEKGKQKGNHGRVSFWTGRKNAQ